MAESNYHLEALRKQRIIERKRDAVDRIVKDQTGDFCYDTKGNLTTKDQIMFSGPGDFDNNRLVHYGPPKIHHRKVDNNPEDKVFPLLHPQEYEIKRQIKQLPPRKPHFKV